MKSYLLIALSFIALNCFSQTNDEMGSSTKIIRKGKPFLTKDAIKLLKEFDSVHNINSGITSFKHKKINTTNTTSTTYYYPTLGISSKTPNPSTVYLTIFRLPNGVYTIGMNVFYVFPSTATSRIEEVSSFTFKWDNNSYTISNKNGNPLKFAKFLDDNDYDMFIELAKSSKDAEVAMQGTNSLQVIINFSKHDRKKMLETIQLFQELIN